MVAARRTREIVPSPRNFACPWWAPHSGLGVSSSRMRSYKPSWLSVASRRVIGPPWAYDQRMEIASCRGRQIGVSSKGLFPARDRRPVDVSARPCLALLSLARQEQQDLRGREVVIPSAPTVSAARSSSSREGQGLT